MYESVKCIKCGFKGTVEKGEEKCPGCNTEGELQFYGEHQSYDKELVWVHPKRPNIKAFTFNKRIYRYSADRIFILSRNEVFVFGSNLAGIHGAGAALTASKSFKAKKGVGVGETGDCYAIPTKDKNLKVLPIEEIKKYIYEFISFAKLNKKKNFLITEIGCGLAGYKCKEIAHLFKECLNEENVILPKKFIEELVRK